MDREHQLQALRAAVDWGLDRGRPAWIRTSEFVGHSSELYRSEDLEAARERIASEIDGRLEGWLEAMTAASDGAAPELESPPAEIWHELLCLNRGVFSTEAARDLLLTFTTTIGSTVPGSGPLYVAAHPDGWGMAPAPAQDS